MENNWHDIPGYEWLYQFNWHTNQVKSLERKVVTYFWLRTVKERILSVADNWFVTFVALSKNSKIESISLWRLTLLITQWPKPKWMSCCHNDNNRWNNFPENVRYDTHQWNMNDRKKNWGYGKKVKRLPDWIIFDSITDACKALWKSNKYVPSITNVCRWIRKTAYGYRWEYVS